jgi:hypothetical protein
MIGLSTFSPPPPTTSTLSAGPGSNPSAIFDFGNNNTGFFAGRQPQTLAYPLDTPKYIMTFTLSEYTRQNLNTVGTFRDSGYPGIIMPLPQQLVNNDQVLWQEVEIGTLPGVVVNGLATAAQGGQVVGQNAAGAAGLLGISAVAGALSLPVGGGGSDAVEAMLGFSPNQFVTMLMRGPQYKRHSFSWELSPTNYEEANILREIIKIFRNAMAPNVFGTFGGAPIVWTFPKIFYIRLYPNSKFMYKFKPAVCDHFTVNYSPGSRPAFSKNGTGTIGDNPPANIQIVAHFIELEFWIEGNVTDSNDPNDVHAQAVLGSTPLDTAEQFDIGLLQRLNALGGNDITIPGVPNA